MTHIFATLTLALCHSICKIGAFCIFRAQWSRLLNGLSWNLIFEFVGPYLYFVKMACCNGHLTCTSAFISTCISSLLRWICMGNINIVSNKILVKSGPEILCPVLWVFVGYLKSNTSYLFFAVCVWKVLRMCVYELDGNAEIRKEGKGQKCYTLHYSFQHFNYHHHFRNIFGTWSVDVMVRIEHECWLLTSFHECDIRPKFHIKRYFSDLMALHASLLQPNQVYCADQKESHDAVLVTH